MKAMNRRNFIQKSSAAAAFSIVPRFVLGGKGYTAPSEMLHIAGIGIGGVGQHFIKSCADEGQKIVALCDVDHIFSKPVFDKHPDATTYYDFREMFDTEKDIDAVVIGTPDHSHAVIAMHALRMKKHILCVKPLTRTIHEARVLTEAARAAGVATQVTASSRLDETVLRNMEIVQSGILGDIREVHCWTDRPWWPQGMTRPEGKDTIPETLKWDLWLGPAHDRPYKKGWGAESLVMQQLKARVLVYDAVYHPFNFRGWWDFGTGAMGDMGCHFFNRIFPVLNLGHPVSVHASSTTVFPETPPLAAIVTYEFPERKGMPPVKLIWYEGGIMPSRPEELQDDEEMPANGTLFVGDRGKILNDKVIPENKRKEAKKLKNTLSRPEYPEGDIVVQEWINACKGGPAASCNFNTGGELTEIALLGNIATRTGKKIYWDPEKMEITNNSEANGYIRESYRSGWSLET
jgi:predicted dehydrogenase